MIHYNLRTADPPPGAIYQYPGSNRPGNSFTPMIGIQKYKDDRFNLYCIDDKEKSIVSNLRGGNNNNDRFTKYFYLH